MKLSDLPSLKQRLARVLIVCEAGARKLDGRYITRWVVPGICFSEGEKASRTSAITKGRAVPGSPGIDPRGAGQLQRGARPAGATAQTESPKELVERSHPHPQPSVHMVTGMNGGFKPPRLGLVTPQRQLLWVS